MITHKWIIYVAMHAIVHATSVNVHNMAITLTTECCRDMTKSTDRNQQPRVRKCLGQRDRINRHNQRFYVEILLIRSQNF